MAVRFNGNMRWDFDEEFGGLLPTNIKDLPITDDNNINFNFMKLKSIIPNVDYSPDTNDGLPSITYNGTTYENIDSLIDDIESTNDNSSLTNDSTNLIDTLKNKESTSNKLMKDNNKLLKENLKIQSDISKSMTAIAISLATISSDISINKDSNVTNNSFNIEKNKKLIDNLEFENTGKIKIDNPTMSQMFDGITSETLKNTEGDDIIPIHEKAKLYSEKRIDEEKANNTDTAGFFESLIDDLTGGLNDTNDEDEDSDIMSYVLKDFNSENYTEEQVQENLKEFEKVVT